MPAIAFSLLWNVGLATVVAALVAVVCRLRPLQHRPALAHTLWLLVLVKLVTPPLIPVPVFQPAGPAEPPALGALEPSSLVPAPITPLDPLDTRPAAFESPAAPVTPATRVREAPWRPLFLWTSASGTLILAIFSAARFWSASRILRRAAPGNERITGLSRIAAQRMGLPADPRVCVVDAPIVPLLWVRWNNPLIVLPTKLIEPMGDDQIMCILCHELAHYVRKDHWANLFAWCVTALFWWHPAAWWARRRMRAAQELCCDGLVLETKLADRRCYAETLFQALEFVQTCRPLHPSVASSFGDSSSLRRRFQMIATLHVRPRASRPAAILAVAAALVMCCIPVRGEPPAATTIQKPSAPAPTQASDVPPAGPAIPKNDRAQALFARWQANARTDGKIPGALVGQLTRDIDNFLKQFPEDEKSALLVALRPRLDASRDWSQAESVTLLDDITAISTAPVSWRELALTFAEMRNFKPGRPLPAELEQAAWGSPAENGLRAAWRLEPQAPEYAVGTVLKARVLFHNAGERSVVFSTDTWHQWDEHTARDAQGAEIGIARVRYSGLTPTATYRLAPGEYCEVLGHGVAIGAGEYEAQFRAGSVGAVIRAGAGAEVTLTHVVDAATGWTHADSKNWAERWNTSIAARVEREGPLPRAAVDRAQLVRRVTLDIFGVPPSADEIAAFVNDLAPDALAKLTSRLQAKPRIEPWAGRLATGGTKFRVAAAEPTAIPQPVASKEQPAAEDEPKQAAPKLPPTASRDTLDGLWHDIENKGAWLRFDASTITYHPADAPDKPSTIQWTCRYNIVPTPMTIDVFTKDGTSHGIFVLERDTLFIALSKELGADRPTRFKRDDATTLFVLKRVAEPDAHAQPDPPRKYSRDARQIATDGSGHIVVHGILESVDVKKRTMTVQGIHGSESTSTTALLALAGKSPAKRAVSEALLKELGTGNSSKLVNVPVRSDAVRFRTRGADVVQEKLEVQDLAVGQVLQLRLAPDPKSGFVVVEVAVSNDK